MLFKKEIAEVGSELPVKTYLIQGLVVYVMVKAGSKLLLLCDVYMKRKTELSRDQRHEIIRYAKSRLPVFMSQLHRFLSGLKSTLSSMNSAQRLEVATYLVPEVKINCFPLLSTMLVVTLSFIKKSLPRAFLNKTI